MVSASASPLLGGIDDVLVKATGPSRVSTLDVISAAVIMSQKERFLNGN